MSTNGIKTSFWGPHAWAFLFSSVAGTFPIRVDARNKSHVKTVKAFAQMFKSLEVTLPCIYCRQSYGKFIKAIPMDEYTHSRESMLLWLYLIHDQVNKKLIQQERECYETEKARIDKRKLTLAQKKAALQKAKSSIVKTKPSPPFKRVVAMYEKQRAGCNPTTKRCS